jgi:hypothetical protein
MKFSASISGNKKICARWVPRMLEDDHKNKRMGTSLKFLERYHRDGDKFLDHNVKGDETWVSHFTPENKRQSLEWHHPRPPSTPRKVKQTLSTRIIMATVGFMPQGTPMNAESYCATLRRLRYAIQNRRRGLLSSGVMLLLRTLLPERKQCFKSLAGKFLSTQQIVQTWPQVIFTCSQKLNDFLGGRRFKSDKEVKDVVKEWLNELAEVYDEGIQKLVTRYDKCLNVGRGYVEK